MIKFARGSEPLFKRTGTIVYRKEGNLSPVSRYMEFGVYSMNNTGGRRKIFITSARTARQVSRGSAPFKPLCWGKKCV